MCDSVAAAWQQCGSREGNNAPDCPDTVDSNFENECTVTYLSERSFFLFSLFSFFFFARRGIQSTGSATVYPDIPDAI